MGRLCKVLVALVIGVVPVAAQPIHNYPYDPSVTSYDTLPYELCGLPNAVGVEKHYVDLNTQGHWRRGNNRLDQTSVPQMISPSLSHGHIRICVPLGGELKDDLTVPFMVMGFQVDGVVEIDPARQNGIKQIVWDDGGSWSTTGDPNGLVMRTGHMTFDINYRGWPGADVPFYVPDHGMFMFVVDEFVRYANGSYSVITLQWSAWSMKNPSAPEWVNSTGAPEGTLIAINYSLNPNTDLLADNSGALEWGSNKVEYKHWLPLLSPLRADTLARMPTLPMPGLYNYGHGPQRGHGITRFNMDLHAGNPGILFEDKPQTDFNDNIWNTTKTAFDYDALKAFGNGFHSVTTISQQDSGPLGTVTSEGFFGPNEQGVTLLGMRVLIDDSTETPPPPPPPPPTVKTCTGSVNGTSTDGTTITVTSGSITCK